MRRSRRVLFFAEAVTLAHVARPIVLARALDPARYDVVMACDSRYRRFLEHEPWETLPLQSISSEQFMRALASGSPVYGAQTLRDYVGEDLALIARVKPDLIVGDFRLSLSISARLAAVPYAAITNAYWSPYHPVRNFPLPVLPMTRFLPVPVARQLFRAARPLAFGLHCRPLNRVRLENGLPSLGSDLRRVYTDADHVLYADVPSMFPTEHLPKTHRYLGPILWSPPAALPEWWDQLPGDKPIVYLTLGSSGSPQVLQKVLDTLADLPVNVMASTAGAVVPRRVPANAFVANYLPGTQAAVRSKLVICNGGSPTSQQALAAGVPVIGITSNMDQFLNMGAVVAASAGVALRADRLKGIDIGRAVNSILAEAKLGTGAQSIAKVFTSVDAGENFSAMTDEVCVDLLGQF